MSRGNLPPELTRDVAGRLTITGIIMAVLFPLNALLDRWIPFVGVSDGSPPEFVCSAIAVGLSLLLVWLSRQAIPLSRLVDIALVYEVVICGLIAFIENLPRVLPDYNPRGVSWICTIIILFPLLIPARPSKTLVAALLSAAMGPLTLPVALWWSQNPLPSMAQLAGLFTGNFIAVGLATVPSAVISRLGSDVARAREMGSYRLEKLLGTGGMGEVWKAQHSLLSRPAAIKLIRAESLRSGEVGSPELVEKRFRREASATAALRSPHTVALYDFGQAEEGSFYYVMELLDGVDLQDLVDRYGALPANRVVHILTQTCESLEEAHQQRMVHRDVKPANIYVCRLGCEVDFVKILDFGLVKPTSGAALGDSKLTMADTVFGTPAFMAPEQAMGYEVDARSDIYALGCVAYWLLTGQYVFPSTAPLQVVSDHIHSRPIPPSNRTLSPIPPELERVVLKCLEKDPAKRPQSALELQGMLDACRVSPPWTQELARAWWDEHLPQAQPEKGPVSAAPAGAPPARTVVPTVAEQKTT